MKRLALALIATVVSTIPASAVTVDFSLGSGGFAEDVIFNGGANWTYTNNRWELTGGNNSNIALVSPVFTATGGAVNLQFTHARNFESSFDGGIVELSLNGGAFTKVADGAFTQNGYNAGALVGGPLAGQTAFTGSTSSQVSIAGLGTFVGGDNYQLRFRAGFDASVINTPPNWILTSLSVDNTADLASIPEPSTFGLGIAGLTGLGLAVRRKRS